MMMSPDNPGWSGSDIQCENLRNTAPCAHCGEFVDEDDSFRIVDGELVHEACRDAFVDAMAAEARKS